MTEPQAKKKKGAVWIIVAIVAGVGCLPCIGILAAVAIPSFVSYTKRAKASEARSNLGMIRVGIESYQATYGTLPAPAPRTPATPGCAAKQPFPLGAHPTWSAIGFTPMEPLFYAYEVETYADGTYRATAVGDLDCDGIYSTFEVSTATGGMITAESELE